MEESKQRRAEFPAEKSGDRQHDDGGQSGSNRDGLKGQYSIASEAGQDNVGIP